MKPLPYLKVLFALNLANGIRAQSAKPVHQLVFSAGTIENILKLVLGNLWLQLDQTGDASHAQTITSKHTICVAATPAEIAACTASCKLNNIGNPDLIKACVNGCRDNRDCHQECGPHSTANFIRFGGAMKALLTKNCTTPTDSCPNCILNDSTPLVDDIDATGLIPNPVVSNLDIGIGTISCTLTRFTVNLNVTGTPDYDQLVTTDLSPSQGIHINIKGNADSPTLKCTGAISTDLTFQNPNFDFYLNPSVTKHKANWAVSGAFHSGDSRVDNNVNSLLGTFLSNPNNTASVSKGVTDWMAQQISIQNNEDVDDLVSIVTTTDAVTVSYTTKCVNDVCTCGASCNGLHFCDPNYWTSAGPGLICMGGEVCLTSGDCCTPSCFSNGCGSDGCGGTCGTCAAGLMCSAKRCVPCTEGPCNHICSKTVCGTWCGTCRPGFVCGYGGCQDSRGPQ
jgi:hypothetical protein